MTEKSLQINIAIDSYNRLNRAVKSKGYLTRDKRKTGFYIDNEVLQDIL